MCVIERESIGKQKEKFSRMTGPEMPIGNRLKMQSTINVFFFFFGPTQMSIYSPTVNVLIRIGKTSLYCTSNLN